MVVEVGGGETPTPPKSLEQWGAEPTILTNWIKGKPSARVADPDLV